eukprot:scaffold119336_cov15-Tisochrysis_lutea.AAC.1
MNAGAARSACSIAWASDAKRFNTAVAGEVIGTGQGYWGMEAHMPMNGRICHLHLLHLTLVALLAGSASCMSNNVA